MFENLETLSPDPILGLMAAFNKDKNTNKIDLGVGVYRDESGQTPIMNSVLEAQQLHHQTESTKAYIGPPGTPRFNELSREMMFGSEHSALTDRRVAGVQTPGGCGALRVAAELIKRASLQTTIWVSNPTWANHRPLLGNAGINIKEYAYYDNDTRSLNETELFTALDSVPAGDIVLLHGCCHNPSGVDLEQSHWETVAQIANKKGFIPFIDLAYQGLGESLIKDSIGVRILGEACAELIVASSYSKNFGLYRERVGSLQIVSPNTKQSNVVQSQLGSVVRGIYSMPPSHGAAIVESILGDERLEKMWRKELESMRNRINLLRTELASGLSDETRRDFSFIKTQRGMFSFLGISAAQVAKLQENYAIYMVDSSRINVAGINDTNIEYFIASMKSVLSEG
ncbi:MAG: aromatic amino acid transaminase [Gammaproteobacteria bacterium]|jgi:aspartate aminotransferase